MRQNIFSPPGPEQVPHYQDICFVVCCSVLNSCPVLFVSKGIFHIQNEAFLYVLADPFAMSLFTFPKLLSKISSLQSPNRYTLGALLFM